jgi:hypothetical protein
MGIGFPSMRAAQAAGVIDITQSAESNNICAGALCFNAGNNFDVHSATHTGQEVDVHGSQDVNQTNICADDTGDVCSNTGLGGGDISNLFFLSHDGAADVTVGTFNQNVSSENVCSFFDACTNQAANTFSIVAQDKDGATATGFDVNVSRSSQVVDQVNDCQGTPVVGASPSCANAGFQDVSIQALNDGNVLLESSDQDAVQANNCDAVAGVGDNVTCGNGLVNALALRGSGTEASVHMIDNAQVGVQINDCTGSTLNTTCVNDATNFANADAHGDSSIIVHDNTQVGVQTNDCSNTGVSATFCGNSNVNFFNVTSAQDAVDTEASNTQVAVQANACTDSPVCQNIGPNVDLVTATGNSLVHSEDTQVNLQTNGCLGSICSNDNTNFNNITASDSSKLTSGKGGTTQQIALQDNACAGSICDQSSANANQITASDDSKAKSTAIQVVDQGIPGSLDTGNRCAGSICVNSATNTNALDTSGTAGVESNTVQTIGQGNTCAGSICSNDNHNLVDISADSGKSTETHTQNIDSSNTCAGTICASSQSNNVIVTP